MKVTLQLEQLSCPSCASKIGSILKQTKGVLVSEVLFTSSKVKIDFDPEIITVEELERLVEKAGYKVIGRR